MHCGRNSYDGLCQFDECRLNLSRGPHDAVGVADEEPFHGVPSQLSVPGAGLWYLRMFRAGWINFLIVMVPATVLIFGYPNLYQSMRSPYALLLAVVSGSLAFACTRIRNQKTFHGTVERFERE